MYMFWLFIIIGVVISVVLYVVGYNVQDASNMKNIFMFLVIPLIILLIIEITLIINIGLKNIGKTIFLVGLVSFSSLIIYRLFTVYE